MKLRLRMDEFQTALQDFSGKKDKLGKCVEIPDKAGDELPTMVENIYENDLSLKADLI